MADLKITGPFSIEELDISLNLSAILPKDVPSNDDVPYDIDTNSNIFGSEYRFEPNQERGGSLLGKRERKSCPAIEKTLALKKK